MDRLTTNETTPNMAFKQGTHVFTSDNHDVGSIERIVLDPQTNEVSAVVVRQGWLFTEDKVVPISMVAATTEDRVTLQETREDLEDLPKFEETYYVSANEAEYRDEDVMGEPYVTPLYNYPPVGTAWWGFGDYYGVPPLDPRPELIERKQRNIPDNMVAVKEGARIVSSDGEHVGNVEEIFTDAETNHATHIIISQGLLFKDRKLIPTNWVKNAGEDEIVLTVNTRLVDSLPEYEG